MWNCRWPHSVLVQRFHGMDKVMYIETVHFIRRHMKKPSPPNRDAFFPFAVEWNETEKGKVETRNWCDSPVSSSEKSLRISIANKCWNWSERTICAIVVDSDFRHFYGNIFKYKRFREIRKINKIIQFQKHCQLQLKGMFLEPLTRPD